MFVTHNFTLSNEIKEQLYSIKPKFGFSGLGEVVYLRTYSRKKENGIPENWADTIIRVVEGVISIAKTHMLKNRLSWDENYWKDFSKEFAMYMFEMKFLPPGRGLWAMGTDYVKNKGSMALNNCAFVDTTDILASTCWTMDALMCGCGVGFNTKCTTEPSPPTGTIKVVIEDSREGWVNSFKRIMFSFFKEGPMPEFDYSQIRPLGASIKGFGGTASGPDPLIKLHERIICYLYARIYYKNLEDKSKNIEEGTRVVHTSAGHPQTTTLRELFEKVQKNTFLNNGEDFLNLEKDYPEHFDRVFQYINSIKSGRYSLTRMTVDIMNAIGSCVVAGNVRRSSEISLGSPEDADFIFLKDLTVNPERQDIYWMSNNTVQFENTEQFGNYISLIADQIVKSGNGEPGIYNMLNVTNFGRVNKFYDAGELPTREREKDKAIGVNPCLTSDTEIYTEEGIFTIEQLIGKQFKPLVYSVLGCKLYGESTEKGFWFTGEKQVWKITLENGNSIKATENHRFLNSKDVWEEVRNIKENDILETIRGPQKVMLKEYIGVEKVYDCTINEHHKFIANTFISHNCGEIPLESYEMCNLSEVFPSRCVNEQGEFDEDIFYKAIHFATLYSSIVSLLPTHSPLTNAVVARNHRIGVSLSGTALMTEKLGYSYWIDIIKHGYKVVREVNSYYMDVFGSPHSIRVTTIKPSGTISKLVGVPAGIHFPIENRYVIRRIRVSMSHNIADALIASGVPYEKDTYADNTWVFEFPVDQGECRSLKDVSMWEQLKVAELYQRWWSDNSVSVTINYDENEAKSLEEAISTTISNVKCLSFAPKSNIKYVQRPVEGITEEEYFKRKETIGEINLSSYKDGKAQEPERPNYCDGESCEIPKDI